MPDSRIFFLADGQATLEPLTEAPYSAEDILQALVANYPDLLPGDEINPVAPRRWLTVAREMPVPDEQGGSDRWSLDNLLLDQDAVPTLVEVKRSSDTRIRREVVGQMLDKALVPRVVGLTEAARTAKGASVPLKKPTSRTEFLARCEPPVARFYMQVLDEAEARGHAVDWKSAGFALRASMGGDGKLATFVYGYLDSFQFYFGYLPFTSADATAVRAELVASKLFEASGNLTLEAPLREEVTAALLRTYRETILERVACLVASSRTTPVAVEVN